jgi:putative SOS response-associated peptidase YedK
MCGRFACRLTWPVIVRLYRLSLDAAARNTQPRNNICPTTTIDAVIERDDKRELLSMRGNGRGGSTTRAARLRAPLA